MRERLHLVLMIAVLAVANIAGSPRGEFADPASSTYAKVVVDASEVLITLTETSPSGRIVHVELRGDGALRREDGIEGEKTTVIEREITDLREIAAYLDAVVKERFFELPPRVSPPDGIRVGRDNRYFVYGPGSAGDVTEVTLHVSIGYRSNTVQFGDGQVPGGIGQLAERLIALTEVYR